MSTQEDAMAAKQTYIREHIPQDKYQQFYEFCETQATNMDIENWSINFVRELVLKFMKKESDKENSNKKKQHQPFFAYQTGNASQLRDLRQQIKEDRKNMPQQNYQTQKTNTPEKPKQKPQQSALQLLDSIFSNSSVNNVNQAQFQSKKYDKSYFQSCNFWGFPAEENKKEMHMSPSAMAKNQLSLANNSKPAEIPNFDKVFQTGMNLPQIRQQIKPQTKPQKIQKKREQNKANDNMTKSREWKFEDIPINGNVSKTREWKLEDIPIEDDNTPKTTSNQNQTRPASKKQDIKIQPLPKNDAKNSSKLTSNQNIKQPKISYIGETLIKQPFVGKVACFKSLQRMNFSSQKLKITIQGHETITRSFFSSNYIMYHLRFMPGNTILKRNLEDFQKLKNNLEGVYPGIRLPYLEKPGWLQSETTPEFIQKQKKYLTYFLQDVFSHPQLRNSRILQDFLTLKDHKSIKRKFEEYEKIKKVTSIEQLCLMEGEVKVQISEPNRQYNQYMNAFLGKMNLFWDSQQRILGQISTIYDSLVDNYQKWMEAVEAIQKEIKDFNKKVCFNELTPIEAAFKNLSRYIAQCSNFNLSEKQFLQSNIFPLFRFEKQNMNLLGNIMNIQQTLTRVYLKRKDAEKNQDNVEYLSERLKDYKINILHESGSITVLKYQCGYMNQMAVAEAYRYFDRLNQKVMSMIGEVCKGKLGRLSQSINTITQLVHA